LLPNAAFRLIESVGIGTRIDFGAVSHGLLPRCVRFVTHQSPGEWQHSLLTCLLDFGQTGFAPARLEQEVSLEKGGTNWPTKHRASSEAKTRSPSE
jgi:hypothetical protein